MFLGFSRGLLALDSSVCGSDDPLYALIFSGSFRKIPGTGGSCSCLLVIVRGPGVTQLGSLADKLGK